MTAAPSVDDLPTKDEVLNNCRNEGYSSNTGYNPHKNNNEILNEVNNYPIYEENIKKKDNINYPINNKKENINKKNKNISYT